MTRAAPVRVKTANAAMPALHCGKTPARAVTSGEAAALSAPPAGRAAIEYRAVKPGCSLSALRIFPPPHDSSSGQEVRETAPATPSGVPNAVGAVLRSGGEPLDTAARAAMEPRFKHDFSHVRVHADTPAAQSAKAVAATAYTVGHHIVFGAGRYDP